MTLVWKTIIALSTATLLLCASGIIYAAGMKPVQPATVVIPLNADMIFNLVNNERTKAGLQPLVRDARLDATARARATDMNQRNYFSHYDPIDGHLMISDKTSLSGATYCSASSENISNGIFSDNGNFDRNVVRSWMESKLHHDAILNASYTTTGVAINGTKVVQHFCTIK